MKLLSVVLARSFWVGHTADLNPKGISTYPLIVAFLVDRYKFKKYPDPTKIPIPPPTGEGMKFEWGEFTISEGITIGVGLSLHTDGIMADTYSSTENADAFLLDMLTHYGDFFRSRDYNEVLKSRLYLSQLSVSTDRSLQTINPKLNEFAALFAQHITPAATTVEFGGISFWAESTGSSLSKSFTFERAINVPFSENRYYSAAPLPTGKHLELLNTLEDILA